MISQEGSKINFHKSVNFNELEKKTNPEILLSEIQEVMIESLK